METLLIPLTKLRQDAANVRHPKENDVALVLHDMQASLLEHGQLSALEVRPIRKLKGHYAVFAGGRRLLAFKGLAADGRIAPDFLVRCDVHQVDDATAAELSAVENIIRVNLKPTEEFEVFAKLSADGVADEDIARRFGIELRAVRQRQRLGKLHPLVFTALDEGRITLDQAKAYAGTEDQALQARVFGEMSEYNHTERNIRNAIRGAGSAYNAELMLRVVGVHAYTAAGGQLEEDLFDGGFRVIQPGTLSELYYAKIEQQKAELAAKLSEAATITTSGTDLGRWIGVGADLEPEQRDRLTAIDKRTEEIEERFEQLADVDEKPENAPTLEALHIELDALRDEGEAIHANAKVTLPDGPVVVYAQPSASGLVVQGYYRPKGYAEDGAARSIAGAGTPPAASLDKPIGLDPRMGFGDAKQVAKAETGLTADALEVMRSHRRQILRGMMVDHREPYARAIGAMYLPFTVLRTCLGEGKYTAGRNSAAEVGIAQGLYHRATPPLVDDLAEQVTSQPGSELWGAAIAEIERSDWMQEPDLRTAFAMFRGLSDRAMDLAGAVAAGLLLDRSLNVPCYRVPLHDEIATLIGVADRDDVRRYITLDAAFFQRLPKSRRIAAVAQVSPSISKIIGAMPNGDVSGACAEFFAGSDYARRTWKMTAEQIAVARRWLPSFLEFNEDAGKPRIADVIAAEAEEVA